MKRPVGDSSATESVPLLIFRRSWKWILETGAARVVVAADSVPVDVPDQIREFEATGGHDGVREIR